MIRVLSFLVVLMMCGFFFCSVASAGFVVHKEMLQRDDMTGKTRVESRVNYFDTDQGKFAGDDGIMRFDTGEMIILNPSHKVYYRNTLDGYCKDIQGFVNEFTSSPQFKKLDKMAKDAEKNLKKQYGDQPLPKEPKPTLHKIGKDRIAGFNAEHYEVRVGSDVDREVWIATDSRLSDLDIAKNSRLRKRALAYEKKLHHCLGKFSQMSHGSLEEKDPLEDATSFELRSRDSYTDERVTSIKEQHLAASHFEPPANFRRVSFKEYMSTPKGEPRQAYEDSSVNDQQPPEPEISGGEPSDKLAEQETASDQEKGWMQKDAEDLGGHAVKESHNQTKRAVENQISNKVKEGVKGFMKLFGD